jgi:hypothetical protein
MQQPQPIPAVRDEDEMQELLYDLLDEQAIDEPELRVQTFENAGVLMMHKGIVVRMPGGALFALTIKVMR